ncbi:hypothetical protein LJ707_05150 [Mucilaginibacter sp. UR6-1]|uniref:hypothetical protein n=1 Tax=Mucilaginibacter sp. UR6-1 TaxID=1435643 RepID=UPI001E347202|nr:hypothetical protein [Mucilaginibacter sp. UR6-1]MCC8408306.1 hypothetical protein [Mucilaginibacter sp. UR6-1]
MITDFELNQIEARCLNASAGPWKSFIEGRDHESGSDFIMTGSDNDIELTGATQTDYDFIANAKQDVPYLIAEIRKLRNELTVKNH